MDFNAAELAALDGDFQQKIILVRAQTTTGVIRIWFGVAPFSVPPGIDSIYDPAGAAYNGFGQMMNAPIFQQMLNGSAERLEFILSGTSPQVMALASAEANTVKRQPVAMGVGFTGPDWQLLGDVHWCWRGVADYVKTEWQGASEPGQSARQAVKMSVASIMASRRRRALSYWTNGDFQVDHPGDRFCERTLSYDRRIIKSFPRW